MRRLGEDEIVEGEVAPASVCACIGVATPRCASRQCWAQGSSPAAGIADNVAGALRRVVPHALAKLGHRNLFPMTSHPPFREPTTLNPSRQRLRSNRLFGNSVLLIELAASQATVWFVFRGPSAQNDLEKGRCRRFLGLHI